MKRLINGWPIELELILVKARYFLVTNESRNLFQLVSFDSISDSLDSTVSFDTVFKRFHVVGKWTPPLSTLSISLSLEIRASLASGTEPRRRRRRRPLTSLRFGRHYRGIFNRGLDGARTPLACHTRPNKTQETLFTISSIPSPLPYLSRHLQRYEASR